MFYSYNLIKPIIFYTNSTTSGKSSTAISTAVLIFKFTWNNSKECPVKIVVLRMSQLVSCTVMFSWWDFLSSLGRPKTCHACVPKSANTKRIKQEAWRRHNNIFVHAQLKQNSIDQWYMVTRSYGLIMMAVHQDHPFNEHFKMLSDPDSTPDVFQVLLKSTWSVTLQEHNKAIHIAISIIHQNLGCMKSINFRKRT